MLQNWGNVVIRWSICWLNFLLSINSFLWWWWCPEFNPEFNLSKLNCFSYLSWRDRVPQQSADTAELTVFPFFLSCFLPYYPVPRLLSKYHVWFSFLSRPSNFIVFPFCVVFLVNVPIEWKFLSSCVLTYNCILSLWKYFMVIAV